MSRLVGIRGLRPRRSRLRLRWLGLAAVAATVGLAAGPAGMASAAPSGELDQVVVSGTSLSAVLSASDVPQGSVFDPASVVVTVDGHGVPATATADALPAGSTAPRQTAMLVVDTSGSMAGTPLAQAKQAAVTFLSRVPAGVSVGLVSFSDSPHVLVRPTTNRAAVRAQVAALKAAGGTALYDALETGTYLLGTSGDRLMVVLSDGADTSSRGSLAAATQRLRLSKAATAIVAYRVDAAQNALLVALAADVGGRVIPASDANGLVAAFGTAATSFATEVDVSAVLAEPLAAGEHAVTASVRFGTYTLTGATTYTAVVVPVGVDQPTVAPLAAAPVAVSGWLLGPTLLVVFVALLLLLLAVLGPRGTSTSRQSLRRVDDYRPGGSVFALSAAGPPGTQPAAQGQLTQAALGLSDRVVQNTRLGDGLALRLDRADIKMRPNEYLLLAVCGGLVVTAVVAVLFHTIALAVLVGVLVAWGASYTYLRVKESKRTKAFAAQLPDTLQLLASSIRTGFSFSQALDAAMRNGQQPMAGELNRALAEARLGAPLEDGLERVAIRMDSEDLRWTVMAVRIQHEVGGNLAEVLYNTAKTMRERAALRRHVHALAAEGRLSAYILVGLPILLFAYLFMSKREYLSLLWTTVPGAVMSIGGVLLLVVGSLWMRKLAHVEV